MRFSTAITKIIDSLTSQQRTELQDEVQYFVDLLQPPAKPHIFGAGSHWKHKRETNRCFLLDERGVGSDLYTYEELLPIIKLKPQYFAVKLSKSGGKFTRRLDDRLFTITKLSFE